MDFIAEESLDNPKFSLQKSRITRFTIALAKHLGLTVAESDETVIIQGGRMLRDVGNVIKNVFK